MTHLATMETAAPARAEPQPLGWLGIVRLGLVQTALGAIVVLTTSTMNRVMVVELALPAMLPGALVAIHYAIQLMRPAWGYGSDMGGRRTPWIIGGIGVLGLGGVGAALSIVIMEQNLAAGVVGAIFAFVLIGMGVGASGTSLLALLATRVAPDRRGPAATIVWVMMIAGFIVTAATTGSVLDPYSSTRLLAITAIVAALALVVAALAVSGVEGEVRSTLSTRQPDRETPSFREALGEVWAEPKARRFSIFVFASMLAYSAQDLILEPYAGLIFAFSPGQSTKLSGVQHMGVLLGMVLVAVAGIGIGGRRFGSLKAWTVGGCLCSGATLLVLSFAGSVGPSFPLRETVFVLGLSNGAFAVAAIGSMMGLAAQGRENREGLRMGLWGAAQAIAFGLGGFIGAAGVDIGRYFGADVAHAYMAVFAAEALLFLWSAALARSVGLETITESRNRLAVMGDNTMAEHQRGSS